MASEKDVTRRELMKLALLGSGYVLLPGDRAFAGVPSSFASDPRSRRLTPFHKDAVLTVPPQIPSAEPFAVPRTDYEDEDELEQRSATVDPTARFINDNTTYDRIVAAPRFHQFHPDLPPTAIWGYQPEIIPPEFDGTWPRASELQRPVREQAHRAQAKALVTAVPSAPGGAAACLRSCRSDGDLRGK